MANLVVRTASSLPNAQDVIDERLDGVKVVLVSEDFLHAAGAVSASYAGYEFDVDPSFAEGSMGISFTAYEEAAE